jgi:hypothetical protein
LSAFSKSTFRLNTSRLFSPNSDGFESIIAKRLSSSPANLVRADYAPHGGVAAAWEARETEVCLVGPAGSGKSRGWLERLHRDALAWPKSRQLVVRLTRKSLTQSAMVTLQDEVFPVGTFGPADSDKPLRFHSERQAYLYPNGAIVGVVGLDDPGTVFSSQWDRIYCQEVNQLAERPYSTLLRALRNNVMPWQQIVSDMNPQIEMHWMHQRCDERVCREISATHADNPSNTAAYLAGLAKLKGAEYESLYLGQRVTEMEGSYYGGELRALRLAGRVRGVAHDPMVQVFTCWDLGIDDYLAIWWVQRVGTEWHWLWYHEENGQALPHYSQLLREVGRERGYDYGAVLFPHDGGARELGTGKTRQETMAGLRWRVEVLPPHRLDDQHEAARNALATSYFDDNPAVRLGLQRLGSYRKAQDPATGLYLGRPVHDEASHGASAFATGVMGGRLMVTSGGTPGAARQVTPF